MTVMLRADQFTAGSISDASPLSILMPRAKHEETILIARYKEKSAALFLSGPDQFRFFNSEGNTAWNGLIIPNVSIEVDLASVFNPNETGLRPGTLVRQESSLFCCAIADSLTHTKSVLIEDGLAPASDQSAAFSKWAVVIGQANNKQVLFEVDTKLKVT